MLRRSWIFTAPLLGTLVGITANAPAFAAEPILVPLMADRLNSGNVTLAPKDKGLKATFGRADWPTVGFRQGNAYTSADWSQVGGIAFELHNPETTPLMVFVRVDDSKDADGTNHCQSGNATLAPGETTTLVFAMGAAAPGMRGGPPIAPGGTVISTYGPALDATNIVAFQLFLSHPEQPRNLEIRSVRLMPKPDLVGIVDRWGQYAKADWPGKIHTEADLTKTWAAENAWRAAHPPLPDRDEYGGWKNGSPLKATGFFRTAFLVNDNEQTPPAPGKPLPQGARWWLVTPSGHRFWSAGVTCVRPYAEGPINGRMAMFTDLPDAARKTGQTDFYWGNLQSRFRTATVPGKSLPEVWATDAAARLQSLGFNTIANWSEPAIMKAHKVPFVVPLGIGGLPEIGAGSPGRHALPDYFDPKFPALVQQSLTAGTAAWKSDSWCLGYFVDNELPWDTWAQMGTGGEHVVARETLTAPATQPARQAFVALLKAKYKTPADWGKAWGIPVTDWDAPQSLTPKQLNEAARADCAAFLTALAERYFSVIHTTMKAVAPNQLYLGCRFAIRPREVVAVAAKYCDVVSFNIYSDTVDTATWNFTATLGKPVVIGEYHFGATDRGMFHPGLRGRPDQAERAKAYQAYVNSVMRLPAFVGCHWFQYIDEPLTGRFDGENYNIGFVNVTDGLYPEMRDAARELHSGLYTGLVRMRE